MAVGNVRRRSFPPLRQAVHACVARPQRAVAADKVSRIEMIADHDVLEEIDIDFVRRGSDVR